MICVPGGGTLGPRHASDLTELCNARCVHCDIWKNQGKEDSPSASQWLKVLDDLRSWLGPVSIVFTGGEALLKPYAAELDAHAQQERGSQPALPDSAEDGHHGAEPRRVGRGGPIRYSPGAGGFLPADRAELQHRRKSQVVRDQSDLASSPGGGCPRGSAIDPAQARWTAHRKHRRALRSHDPVFPGSSRPAATHPVSRSATEEASLRRPDEASIAEQRRCYDLQSPPSRRQHQGVWDPPDLGAANALLGAGMLSERRHGRPSANAIGNGACDRPTEKLVAGYRPFRLRRQSAAGRRCGDVRARVVPATGHPRLEKRSLLSGCSGDRKSVV